MQPSRLFHISEDPNIQIFLPRPSPGNFEQVTAAVVFAVSDKLLHNYLFPRDCPRVAFYKKENSTEEDIDKFFGQTSADYIIATESYWYPVIQQTKLFCYEFLPDKFILLDECAGYYISYVEVKPLSVMEITDLTGQLMLRNIELRFTPDLRKLAALLKSSSLNFSLIRMRNARTVFKE